MLGHSRESGAASPPPTVQWVQRAKEVTVATKKRWRLVTWTLSQHWGS